jgi:hypothetical protein
MFIAAMMECPIGKDYSHAFVLAVGAKPNTMKRICDGTLFNFGEKQKVQDGMEGYYADAVLYSTRETCHGERERLPSKTAPAKPSNSLTLSTSLKLSKSLRLNTSLSYNAD